MASCSSARKDTFVAAHEQSIPADTVPSTEFTYTQCHAMCVNHAMRTIREKEAFEDHGATDRTRRTAAKRTLP